MYDRSINDQNARPKVLFLCVGNMCRSQMDGGWARHLHADRVIAYSAWIEKHGLNPNAVRAMGEIGIDNSGHQSKTLDELSNGEIGHAGISVAFGLVAMAMIYAIGRISGTHMNPARSLGPAIVSGHLEHLWVYLLIPIAGAVAGALLNQPLRHEDAQHA